ncbi:MAG: hypothetical protein COZ06_25665 [Armatimonadetes bacterium CG_4_10_14_3_um_filter_66_18]|nr:MAG: hypothetical protein AUJ96_05835 [Armatimonadetes bacterium CG2_30_66_41]PIU88882.1 MAG: hypothetical protein COS65_29835 [Armatimonadetes bacterium CG06_land_8_20_14_3_00_66_21]PIX37496.1 MAG: hypothetical protein COZ57_34055 [Armatimonadetes bacterium CG_4_8_14_3_um_filter_66_20]PIY42249.1 MAG: hypothetical protein COZ06_25665 [Armatimonadetes bacterium CG_4_10_14_3_um_filter_66_18]PIZ32640.1 MAG: hypothetical protein COY42_30985 [Armatimonadetes bacterium CG_4_10_14_0_8_um_filter_66_
MEMGAESELLPPHRYHPLRQLLSPQAPAGHVTSVTQIAVQVQKGLHVPGIAGGRAVGPLDLEGDGFRRRLDEGVDFGAGGGAPGGELVAAAEVAAAALQLGEHPLLEQMVGIERGVVTGQRRRYNGQTVTSPRLPCGDREPP